MLTVSLYGDLKPYLPTPLELEVCSINELFRALTSQISGLREHIINQALNDMAYEILVDGERYISESQLLDPLGNAIVEIFPVMSGSGSMGRILVGAGLIALGLVTGGIGIISGTSMILVGTSLALGGFYQLFNPPSNDASEGETDKKSFIFSGAVNTAPVNSRVPLILGCGYRGQGLIVGSVTVVGFIRSYQTHNSGDD
jgi:predicted phage tail protein